MTFDLSEKFDTDLRALQPNPREEEKDYLNPRLSISTRFLSRFQDRIRSVYPQSSGAVNRPHGDNRPSPALFLGFGRAELRPL